MFDAFQVLEIMNNYIHVHIHKYMYMCETYIYLEDI